MQETRSRAAAPVDALIREALAAYGMPEHTYELIRHNENITCKVTSHGEFYVLRIHCPVQGFDLGVLRFDLSDAVLMEQEASLLLHLRANGMPELQCPVPDPSGRYTVTLSDGSPAMLLRWVEGGPLEPAQALERAFEIGALAVRLRNASKGFRGARLRYDEALTLRMIREIRSAVEQGHIPAEQGDICVCELETIRQRQITSSQTECWQVIHSDLSPGNLLDTPNGLVPIDFSLSGYAPFAQEIGMLLTGFPDPNVQRQLLHGVRQAGADVSRQDADLFFAYSVLLFITAQHGRYWREAWFAEALTRWCTTLFVHG